MERVNETSPIQYRPFLHGLLDMLILPQSTVTAQSGRQECRKLSLEPRQGKRLQTPDTLSARRDHCEIFRLFDPTYVAWYLEEVVIVVSID